MTDIVSKSTVKVKAEVPFAVSKVYVKKTQSLQAKLLKEKDAKLEADVKNLLVAKFDELLAALKAYCDTRFITMKAPEVWFDICTGSIYPLKLAFACINYKRADIYKTLDEKFDNVSLPYLGRNDLKFNVPTLNEMKVGFAKGLLALPCSYNNDYWTFSGSADWQNYVTSNLAANYQNGLWPHAAVCKHPDGGYCWYRRSDGHVQSFGRGTNNYEWLIMFASCHIIAPNSGKNNIFYHLLKYNLLPKALPNDKQKLFLSFAKSIKKLEPYLTVGDTILQVNTKKIVNDLRTNKLDLQEFGITVKNASVDTENYQPEVVLAAYRDELLNCDHVRANLTPYPPKRLTDLGHWELCEDAETDGKLEVTLSNNQKLVARPPQLDVLHDSVVGIDFGTKSTVVATYYNEARLLSVGQTDLTKAAKQADYENPTAIEIIDFEGFQKAYNAREGRPFTEWEQMTVAHTAAEVLFSEAVANSQIYNSVLSELKQWAADPQRRLRIKDRKGHDTYEIKPFLQLGPEDFNPIEIYAYYLGLYINNMNRGIYLHYLMSFPVNFSQEVRTKLLESYVAGIKKSLPPAILNDEEIMENFEVLEGASEPAGYAITALEENNLEPQNPGDKVNYAVFDFGGGTTDFDFGVEERPEQQGKKRRYNLLLRQFGNGGDPYLGGENILQLLAYEVYKNNIEQLGAKQIPLVLPPKAQPIDGYDHLLRVQALSSEAALLNTKKLAQALRPLWENENNVQTNNVKIKIAIKLFADSIAQGESYSNNFELDVDVERLKEVIREVVAGGIVNFFAACRKAFNNYAELEGNIHIFLAGNSSKADIVKELFLNHIVIEETKYLPEHEGTFKLYLPLPSKGPVEIKVEEESAADENKANVENVTGNDINNSSESLVPETAFSQLRTGKTGVVFGLLRSRKEARDVKIVNENNNDEGQTKFLYFLGDKDEQGKYFVVDTDIAGAEYKIWKPFTYADQKTSELFYTREPKALEGELPLRDVQKKNLVLTKDEISDDEDTMIYIRKVAPDTIEYAVGTEKDFLDYKGKIHELKL